MNTTPKTFNVASVQVCGLAEIPLTGPDENVFVSCQFGEAGLRGWITAQLVGDNLTGHRARTKHALEESFGGGRVTPLLQPDIESGTVLVDGLPEHIRFTAQHREQLIEMPGTARFALSDPDAMHELRAKFIASVAHGFVTHHYAAVEQQFFNVAQAQLKPKVPANGTTDHHCRKAMNAIERFVFFISRILRDHHGDVTRPFQLLSPSSMATRDDPMVVVSCL